jgi:Fic family protein
MDESRHSQAVEAELILDPEERARREASNALEQTAQVQALIAQTVADGRPYKFRPSMLLGLNRAALKGISLYAGLFRPGDIAIGKSKHVPPGAHLVPELVEDLCEYVMERWAEASPIHLSAYVMWRINWIHPFTDGNGRTARAASYLVLSVGTRMLLPGTRTIPEQTIANRAAYYAALEDADDAWKEREVVDLSAMEKLIAELLTGQLLSVAELAGTKNS